MRVAILTLLFLIGAQAVRCQQSQQNIVHFDELSFNSYFEQLAFLEYNKGERDYLKLLLAVDPNVNVEKYKIYRREIAIELQAINKKKFQKAKPEKKIALIYESVNQNILHKYEEDVLFPQVFTTGVFNCLTASAYYGFLLDSLHIPYDFRESYDHVHPVAYPKDLRINIETTDPFAGVQYFDEKLKVRFVNYLLDTKRINRDEYENFTVDSLFNSYYLPGKIIGLAELTGLQYMNDALQQFVSDDYLNAFEQIKKAYYLYPSSKMLAVFQFILNSTLYDSDFSHLSDARFIIYLSRLIREDVVNVEMVANTFIYVSNIVLINRSDKTLYDSIYNYLMNTLGQVDVKKKIEFQYSVFRGKSYLIEYKLKEALELFQRAYELNQENLEVQTLFVSTLAYTFQNSSNEEMIRRMEDYGHKFSGLTKNGMFLSLEMMAYLAYVEESFDFGKPQRALEYLDKFENIYRDNQDLDLNYQLVGNAYSAAAVYFFKKYNKSKAKQYLERGLEIAPDNFELRYRLNSL